MRTTWTIFACWIALLIAAPGQAADRSRSLAELKRDSFTLDGGAPMIVSALAQSSDGYLWLGTTGGLYRFDGETFERFATEPDNSSSEEINTVLVTNSGRLWAGHVTGGVSVLVNGRLVGAGQGAPVEHVVKIVQSSDGDVWVATVRNKVTRLRRYSAGRWAPAAADLVFSGRLSDLLAGRNGTLWTIVDGKLVLLDPRLRHRLVVSRVTPDGRLAQGPDGTMWLVDRGTVRVVAPFGDPVRAGLGPPRATLPTRITDQHVLIDREGTLWDSSPSHGLLRVALMARGGGDAHRGRLRAAETLSSDAHGPLSGGAIFEDREGNIWFGTGSSLDRFRPTSIVRAVAVSDKPGAARPEKELTRYQLWKDGQSRIFVRNGDNIFRLADDGAPTLVAGHVSADATVCAAGSGGLWLRNRPDRLDRVGAAVAKSLALPTGFPSMATYSGCVEDARGALWIAFWNAGIFRYAQGRWQRTSFDPPVQTEPALEMIQDHPDGVLTYLGDGWFARNSAGTATRWFRGPSFVRFINIPYATPRGFLLGSEASLIDFDGHFFRSLSAKRFPFLRDVSDILQTARGDTWLVTANALVRLPTSALAAAFADPGATLEPSVFDAESGFSGISEQSLIASIFEDSKGVIWFSTSAGIFHIDPAKLIRNTIPPTVFIRSLTVGETVYLPGDGLKLPQGTSRIRLAYTATSLTVPERTRFVYRLEGVDSGWIDGGTRREAVYTNLTPGRYRFDVFAANEDGTRSRKAATLFFEIPPTFLQSRWFAAICLGLAAALLWLLYRLRLYQVTTKLRHSMQERTAERERIARELHDTFLQSVQGLILRLQSIVYGLPRDTEARLSMEASLDQARGVVAEGRDRVIALRGQTGHTNLPRVIEDAAERLFDRGRTAVTTIVAGDPRALDPGASDEIAMICDEAMFNIAQHARASRVAVTIEYARRRLVVTIVDNGIGIEPALLQHGRQGHFGLAGMRERAKRLGARLAINSDPEQGTSIILTVPASSAYDHAPAWRLRARQRKAADRW